MSAQLRSPFFFKLPLEVRRIIYEYALGSREIFFQVVNENVEDERGKEKTPFKLTCIDAQLLSFPKFC